ncbi:unnamed protein product, partial [Mesorhabditis belari]|uniref:Globin domain-containing protein n=1 Tax=Mesorhabditis belari TaxID=2138241 RepID=A0AAF3J1H2_9BILA
MYSKNRRTSSQTTRQKQKEVIKRSPTSDTPSETSSIVQTTVTPPIFNETSTTLGSVPVTPSTSGNRLLTPQPARPRSRSLCAQQIEADVQTVNANSPLLSPQVNRENGRETRKHSTGVVPSLNRIRITSAFKIAKSSMGEAILKRASASRPEIRLFLVKLNEEQMSELGRVLFEMIGEGVARLDSADHVQNAGKSAGAAFAVLSPMGFRPDFFAPLADAAIAECVKLDAGSHKRCETLLAWSQLVSALFSAVRDGYYSRIRYQRRSSLPQGQLQIQRVPSLDLCKNAISESP